MTRLFYIQRILRQVYNGEPTDDAVITTNYVNSLIQDAVAVAAKQNYKEAMMVDDICYVNNGFYTTYKGIAVTKDEQFTWKVALPEVPVGIGTNFGISTLQFKDALGNISYPCIPLSENQKTYYQTMRAIPNKTLFYYEGAFIYAKSTILLNQYTASVTMISGGDSTDLTSQLNVPPDYIPVMDTYIVPKLLALLNQRKDMANDGQSVN